MAQFNLLRALAKGYLGWQGYQKKQQDEEKEKLLATIEFIKPSPGQRPTPEFAEAVKKLTEFELPKETVTTPATEGVPGGRLRSLFLEGPEMQYGGVSGMPAQTTELYKSIGRDPLEIHRRKAEITKGLEEPKISDIGQRHKEATDLGYTVGSPEYLNYMRGYKEPRETFEEKFKLEKEKAKIKEEKPELTLAKLKAQIGQKYRTTGVLTKAERDILFGPTDLLTRAISFAQKDFNFMMADPVERQEIISRYLEDLKAFEPKTPDKYGFTVGETKDARGATYKYIGNNQWQKQ